MEYLQLGGDQAAGEGASPNAPATSSRIRKSRVSTKPAFGWDYCFVFRAPKFKPGKVRQISAPVCGAGSDSDGEDAEYSPVNTVVDDGHGAHSETETELEEVALVATSCLSVDENDKDKAISEAISTRCDIIARLSSAGFVYSQIFVPTEKAVYLRFGLSGNALQEKAECMGMELELKEEFGGGYLPFTRLRRDCFKNANRSTLEPGDPYFCPSDRILIILATLQGKETWACDINVEKLVFKNKLLQAFAVHSLPEQAQLTKDVVYHRWWDPTWTPPLTKMKEYLGARVTLYFCFLSHYAQFMLSVSILSVPVYVVTLVVVNKLAIAVLRCIFGLSVVLWTTLLLERWKRRNALVNVEWGLNDYHEDASDNTRPQFRGDSRIGFYCKGGFVPLDDLAISNTEDTEQGKINIDDLPKNAWQDPREARNALLVSLGVTSCCVSIVATMIFLILYFRSKTVAYFEPRLGALANAMPGLLNAVVIAVSDPIWRMVSLALTRRENHRTNQKFENSLVLKRFSFQFFSNYSSLLFIAFIKPIAGTCTDDSCFRELESQMTSLVISKATIQQVLEIGIPFVMSRITQYIAATKGGHSPREVSPDDGDENGCSSDGIGSSGLMFASDGDNQYVAESKLPAYSSTIEDYAEIVIQFGFFSLFGVAFPCAAVVNLINNLIEVRTDAFKILAIAKRTDADDAADIGTWYHILQFLGWISVLTNTGLLVFTNNSVETVLKTKSLIAKVVAFFIIGKITRHTQPSCPVHQLLFIRVHLT
jgi:hypothetical protein